MIHVICGEDAFLARAAEKRLVETLVPAEWRQVSLTVLDGAQVTPAEAVNAARTPSFFGDRLVVVRDCPWFTPATRKKKDDVPEPEAKPETTDAGSTKALIELCKEGLPAGCHLLLVVPRALNKTLSTTKALLAASADKKAEISEFPGPEAFGKSRDRTVAWLVAHGAEVGGGIERPAALALVDRLGEDKYLLDAEIRKLGAYAGARPVRVGDVAVLSPPGESDVFELLETIMSRDLAGAIAHARRLALYDHPLRILAALATYLRAYLQIKLLLERRTPQDAIAGAVKWHPYRVKKAGETMARWTSRQVGEGLACLAEAEQALKGSGLPDALVMERLLAKLAGL